MSIPVDSNLDFQKAYQLLNALLHLLSSDPGSPAEGQVWYNTTSHVPKVYDGTTDQTLAYLASVVNTIADSGAGTITVGGTATARTLLVAKALDHTWITDFTATVEGVSLDLMTAPAGDVSWNNHKITNLTDPTNPQDAVNLRTLLNNVSGLSASQPVAYATNAVLPNSPAYSNGSSGVGATLTAGSNAALVVDGQTVTSGNRILVQNEAAPAHNGIYTVTTVGSGGAAWVLTRATDFNQSSNIGPGILVPVECPATQTAGSVNNGKVFITITATSPTLNTTSITFSGVGGTYTADGTTITLTGSQFSLTSPVSIGNGGTGQTSAAAALAALGGVTKYSHTVGDGSTTSIVVNHALGTTDVQVQCWETGGSKRQIWVEIDITDTNNVTLVFGVAPASNSVRVVVMG